MHDKFITRDPLEQSRADLGIKAGVRAEGEHRADLDPPRPGFPRRGEHLWRAGTSGYPVGQSGLGDLLEVGLVARAEHKIAPIVEQLLARGRVVTSCARRLDDESIRADLGVTSEVGREHVSRDDREEDRTRQGLTD